MKWTTEKFLQHIRSRLDETQDKEFYTDNELLEYLNIAILDCTDALMLKGMKIIEPPLTNVLHLDTIFTTGNPDEGIPDDRFASLEQVFVGGRRVEFTTVEQGKRERRPYQYGDYLVFPEPVNEMMEFYYIRYPLTLQDTMDTTDIPEKYQAIPCNLVIAMAKEKDEEWGQGGQARQEYERLKMEMKVERENRENHQGYTTIDFSYDGS